MGPAGAAILGQVLVTDCGEEVCSVNVLPFPRLRQVGWNQGSVDAGLSSVRVSDTAGSSNRVVFASEGNSNDGGESERFH